MSKENLNVLVHLAEYIKIKRFIFMYFLTHNCKCKTQKPTLCHNLNQILKFSNFCRRREDNISTLHVFTQLHSLVCLR